MNTLVFDIETVPDTDLGRRLYGLKSLTDEQVGTDHARPSAAKRLGQRISLPRAASGGRDLGGHALARLAQGLEPRRGGLLGEGPDRALLRRTGSSYTPDLVSWNGAGFDLPVLHYRSLLHGITAARYWETGDGDASFRYSNYLSRFHWRHMDLMDILSGFQGRGRASLHDVACLLGLPGKLGMHGSQVWEVFLAGGIKRIRDYCETDVLNTYLIYLRFELLRGRLNSAEHAARDRARSAIAARVRAQPTSQNSRRRGPRAEGNCAARGSGRRGSRPRRTRHRASRRQGRLHRGRAARRARALSRDSSGGASSKRRCWSRS